MISTAPVTGLDQTFEQFRVLFPYTRVTVHFDCMVYPITHKKFADIIATEAKNLIRDHQLPLLVEVRRGPVNATILITENKKAI